MNLRYFIDRPVLSAVLSAAIVLMGVISIFNLPVEQYPDIAPPTIQVYTNYPGANAETVQKSVIIPLEEAINGVVPSPTAIWAACCSLSAGDGWR